MSWSRKQVACKLCESLRCSVKEHRPVSLLSISFSIPYCCSISFSLTLSISVLFIYLFCSLIIRCTLHLQTQRSRKEILLRTHHLNFPAQASQASFSVNLTLLLYYPTMMTNNFQSLVVYICVGFTLMWKRCVRVCAQWNTELCCRKVFYSQGRLGRQNEIR